MVFGIPLCRESLANTTWQSSQIHTAKLGIERLFNYWSEAFQFDLNVLANLGKKDQKSLENYLYGYELMVRCKEAAVRVSPPVWEAIETRMVTVSPQGSGAFKAPDP